ncbi:MAG: PepSY domain-containing protein [Sneathiellaceae bacterium]
MIRSKILPAAMAAALVVGASGAAFAGDSKHEMSDAQEAATILAAKTSLSQAIAVAEQQTGGKAIEAAPEQHGGMLAYEIHTAKDGVIQTVLVAPESGKVIKVAAASQASHQEHEDEDD